MAKKCAEEVVCMDTNTTHLVFSQAVTAQLHGFAQRIKTIDPQAHILVFGSHVTGKALPTSDIDVCVISNQFDKDYHGDTISLLRIAHEFPIPMDVIPYTTADLNNKYDPLAKEIQTHGVLIV